MSHIVRHVPACKVFRMPALIIAMHLTSSGRRLNCIVFKHYSHNYYYIQHIRMHIQRYLVIIKFNGTVFSIFYATTSTIFSRYIYMLVSAFMQEEQTLDIPVYRPLRVQCIRTNDNWDILIEK